MPKKKCQKDHAIFSYNDPREYNALVTDDFYFCENCRGFVLDREKIPRPKKGSLILRRRNEKICPKIQSQ